MFQLKLAVIGVGLSVAVLACSTGNVEGEPEGVGKSDAGKEVVAEVVACIGTPCKNPSDCADPGPCVSKTMCEDGCCSYQFQDEGATCQDGCNIGGTCSATGACEGTQTRVCEESDGNPCTEPWCDPETGNCAAVEEPLSDGVVAYSSNCWDGIVCQNGQPDDTNAAPTPLNLQCQDENNSLDPFGCVGQVVCVDSMDECVEISNDDGIECWLEGRGGGCTGRSCVEGECKVDPAFSQECDDDDFPEECDQACQACTSLSCYWIPDPANPDNPSKKVRYCKPEMQVGDECDDGDDCTVGDVCAFGSQADGPLGKETLGVCSGGEQKTKEDCADELVMTFYDCVKVGIGCDPDEGGCFFNEAAADNWCKDDCQCCDVNTSCAFKSGDADEYGCVYGYSPDGTPCNDENECTKDDQCEAAQDDSGYKKCVGIPMNDADLDDGLYCTIDSCDPESGVKHEPIDPEDPESCVEPCSYVGQSLCKPCGNCGEECQICTEPGTPFKDIPPGPCEGEPEDNCAPDALYVQACGNCGQQERICSDSCTWGMWGECQGPGPCSPGELESQACGEDCHFQTRECNDDCDWGPWGECEQKGECVPGQNDPQDCGKCGVQWRSCSDACLWGQWEECEDEGECLTGEAENCGNCGQRTCNELCEWGSCSNEGDCAPNTDQGCGTKCGTQTCNLSCEWGECVGEGPCVSGSTEPCGDCGTRTCDPTCQWGPCEAGGKCVPNEQQDCGNCGKQTCTESCGWGPCTNEGECGPGLVQDCGDKCGERTCNDLCAWGTCKNEGICSPNQQEPCGDCGTTTCDATCQWGPCEDGGICVPGEKQDCGTKCGKQTCTESCGWGPCEDEQECESGVVQDCGSKCGKQTCNLSCQWGECVGEGPCVSGSTEPCGDCGTKTCDITCQWGPCEDGGICVPGEKQDCGTKCGKQTCTESCGWGPCEDEQECEPDAVQDCGDKCGTQTCNDSCQWGNCKNEGACAPNEQAACGVCGTRTCDNSCQWGECVPGGICTPGEQQGCGTKCGTQTCTDACGWGPCTNEGECVTGMQEDCGNMCGKQTCNAFCQWDQCNPGGVCSPNSQQSCGSKCGTQTCDNWCQWGQCVDGGVCSPNDQGQSQACGNCGTQYQNCGNNCQWSWGNCQNEGVCSPNSQGQSQACGKCGTQYQNCGNNCQWSWGTCQNEGVCSPNTQGQSQACGKCGTQYQTCSNACQWSWGSCQNEGVCSPNQQGSSQPCGNKCGTQYKVCASNCQWGGWGSCKNEGECVKGERQCVGTTLKMCNNSCQWNNHQCSDASCQQSGYDFFDKCGWSNGNYWCLCGTYPSCEVCGSNVMKISPSINTWTSWFSPDNNCSCSANDTDCTALYRGRVTKVNGNLADFEFKKASGGGPSEDVSYWLVVSGEKPNCNKLNVYVVRKSLYKGWKKGVPTLVVKDVPIWPTFNDCKNAPDKDYKAFFLITGGGSNPNTKWWFQKDRIRFEKDCP